MVIFCSIFKPQITLFNNRCFNIVVLNIGIVLASHLCTCVLHRQLCYLHTLKLPQFFHFHGDFHQKWHFAHPEVSFAQPELLFLAKSMNIGQHKRTFSTSWKFLISCAELVQNMKANKENKNTLETCKNPRPTSGWSELTTSCTTSTMNFHKAYFSWIPQNNARLKLSCKFGESKCNPC